MKKVGLYIFFGILVAVVLIGAFANADKLGDLSASVFGNDKNDDETGLSGIRSIKIHDGLSNVTTTEDSVNGAGDEMSVLSADANIADGEKYYYNLTIKRMSADKIETYDLKIVAEDKEIDGVTARNLIEKTAGKLDMTIVGADDSGTIDLDESVTTTITFDEGVISKEVQIYFDQEETYHDGMVDLQDSFEVDSSVGGKSVEWVMKANS